MTKYLPTSPNGCIPNVYFSGRWVQQNDSMYTTNLGAQILFKIQNATSFTLEVDVPNLVFPQTLSIYIDDEFSLIRLDQPAFEFKLSSNTAHVVRIYFSGNSDQDEVWQNHAGLTIKNIYCSVGEIQAIKPDGPLVAFIGDSITAGCWVRSKHPSIGYGADVNYAAQLARALNWEDYRIAYSAAGIIRYGTGGVPPAATFLKYIDFDTPAPQVQPELVLVNLGTNDWRFESDVFEMYFTLFVNELQQYFSNARIIIMIPFNQTFVEEITRVAKSMKLSVIPTSNWRIETNDEVHPNQDGSTKITEYLYEWFQSNLQENDVQK